MKHTWAHLREETRSVHLLKIKGFSVTKATISNTTDFIKTRCCVDGYDWEIRFYPALYPSFDMYLVGLELAFLDQARTHHGVTAILSGRLLVLGHKNCGLFPTEHGNASKNFWGPSDRALQVFIAHGLATDLQLQREPALLTVECTITVARDKEPEPGHLPSSDLHRHLDELLQSQAGADVTFTVSGENIPAHKNILAARSPVFKAEFLGEMHEKASQCVEIRDMDADVFKAMLRFIYTDTVPELADQQTSTEENAETVPELADQQTSTEENAETVMVQHLLVAADRYGLDRLKVICEHRLSLGIDVATAASTLALAEQHNCSRLKADCIEFIAGGSPANFDAVLATKGYRHLEASSPSVLTELLKKAVHGKRRSQQTDP